MSQAGGAPRVLFSSMPAFGHVLPMLPLARAAQADGAAVAVTTGAQFEEIVAPLPLLPVGPSFPVMYAEVMRRRPHHGVDVDPEGFAEFFSRVRFDLGHEQLLTATRTFAPDVIVVERDDMVAPTIAAELGVPWLRFHFSPDLPGEVGEAMVAAASERAAGHGLAVEPPQAVLDAWPSVLQPAGHHGAGRLAIRPEPHAVPGAGALSLPASTRPRVLLSTGTIADDEQAIADAVESLLAVELDVVLTGRHGQPWPGIDGNDGRVLQFGFAPLSTLLATVDAAVIAGGAGTLVGCLAAGRPMVVSPMVFDQHDLAQIAQRTGASVTVTDAGEVGPAARRVLDEPVFADAAARVAAEIAGIAAPSEVWAQVRRQLSSAP